MIKKLILLFFGAIFTVWLMISYRLFVPLDWSGKEALLDISPGQSFYQLAEELEEKELIRSETDMKILVWLYRRPALPQGEYEISSGQSLWRIFQNIRQGKEKTFLIRFPEGLNHYEMGALLKSHNWPAAEGFLKAVWNKKLVQKLLNQNVDSLEGYLFPDSYRVRKYMKAEILIKLMLKNFSEVYERFANRPLEYPLSPHQALTLASLIEKETGPVDERSLIAGVFFNRLKRGMRLQTDPSVLYAMYLRQGFDIEKNIRKKDLLMASPYNTYTVKGLPPGPVANPGEKSLRAVFFPEPSEYLYFVSRNDGSHQFSKSYKEHKKAVYKYQIQPFKK